MDLPTHLALQQIHRLDRSSPRFHHQLNNVLHGPEYEHCVRQLVHNDALWFVNYLDKALDHLDPSCPAFRKCLRELRSVCGLKSILPESHTISPQKISIDMQPFAQGGFGDVYKGTCNGSTVCVKRLRSSSWNNEPVTASAFMREAVIWRRLNHPNIVTLLGITTGPYQLISHWIAGGELQDYLKKYPNANRLKLLCDVGKGLDYLHSCSVIHRDLKGNNILVDIVYDTPVARIADFGLSLITKNPESIRPVTNQRIHCVQWSAPEILRGEIPTEKSDIYSFAMIMFLVLTGQAPFHDRLGSVYLLAKDILDGVRPRLPGYHACTESLWKVMERSWDCDPLYRPHTSAVLQILLSSSAHQNPHIDGFRC